MEDTHNIVIISDGTGRTARRLLDAVLIQYGEKDIEFSLVRTYQGICDTEAVNEVLSKIEDDYLVIYSIISQDLSRYLYEKMMARGIVSLSVLRPMIKTLSKFLGVHPDYQPGRLQIVDHQYYKKIDAIGYAVEHDDGLGSLLEIAEVILLGISRTCKTPVSMYLACNHGIKAANIPIVRDEDITGDMMTRLKGIPPERIIGLLMRPDTLAFIREERSTLLAPKNELGTLRDYVDVREIAREHRFSRELFESKGWRTIDVTQRAIEEVSLEILDLIGHKGLADVEDW